MDFEFERDWNKLMKLLMDRFGEQPDLTSAIFSVGLQEAGFGSRSFKSNPFTLFSTILPQFLDTIIGQL